MKTPSRTRLVGRYQTALQQSVQTANPSTHIYRKRAGLSRRFVQSALKSGNIPVDHASLSNGEYRDEHQDLRGENIWWAPNLCKVFSQPSRLMLFDCGLEAGGKRRLILRSFILQPLNSRFLHKPSPHSLLSSRSIFSLRVSLVTLGSPRELLVVLL